VSSPEELAHEIAHWIVAPPSRRSLRHFGLGEPGLETGRKVSPGYAEAEEGLASLLGISLVYTAGNTALAKRLLLDHRWLYSFHRLKKVYAALRESNLVSYNVTPVDPNTVFIPMATFAYNRVCRNLKLGFSSD
jgi:elongation factor P hydroxylase